VINIFATSALENCGIIFMLSGHRTKAGL